jgi:hypothetical protein
MRLAVARPRVAWNVTFGRDNAFEAVTIRRVQLAQTYGVREDGGGNIVCICWRAHDA